MACITLTRRMALQRMAMTVAASMVPADIAQAVDAKDPRVTTIVRSTIGIDTHNHIDVQLDAAGSPGPAIDLAGELTRSGLSAICMTFAVDYMPLDRPGLAIARFRAGMAAMDAALRANGIRRALTAADLGHAHDEGRPIVVQAVEGCHFLEGRIDRLAEGHARGLRHLGLLHDNDADPPLGDVYTNTPRFGGLSPFGREVIAEANKLGMLVDLAHGSASTVRAALAVSTTPVLISHTGLDTQVGDNPLLARMMAPRLIAADLAREVAQAGAVIGVWTHFANSPADYARNVRAMVDVVGVDHVCIGTDSKLTPAFDQGSRVRRTAGGDRPGGGLSGGGRRSGERRPGRSTGDTPGLGRRAGSDRTNTAWPGMQAGFYPAVVGALLGVGFTAEEIGRIGGGNYVRLFAAATKGTRRGLARPLQLGELDWLAIKDHRQI